MNKIPTIFVRDFERGDGRYVTHEVTPGCEWVLAGEGEPTRKFDGTCEMFDGERWWSRREVRAGKDAPADFAPLGTDETTGKTMGWEPVEQGAFAKFHDEAIAGETLNPGTYELCGPKINGNPEGFDCHVLISHQKGTDFYSDDEPTARDYDGLKEWLLNHPYEGIVWHHPDGRMAKIKKKDFPDV